MPTEYTGVATNSHSPSPIPAFNHVVQISVPVDGDPASADVLNQPAKVLADWADFLTHELGFYQGVTEWTITHAYVVGNMVVDTTDHRCYRCVSAHTSTLENMPSANAGKWEQADFSSAEIQDISASPIYSSSGITCSHGASAGYTVAAKLFRDVVRVIFLVINNVPLDGSTNIDLNGATTKFASSCLGAVPGIMSSGWQYPHRCGANINVGGDKNVLTVWAAKDGSDSNTVATVGLIAWGL
jgi:hypothetical protein